MTTELNPFPVSLNVLKDLFKKRTSLETLKAKSPQRKRILTIPRIMQLNASQEICNLMIENGINAIWNFSPNQLTVPEGVLVKQENLALSLAHLNNQLANKN